MPQRHHKPGAALMLCAAMLMGCATAPPTRWYLNGRSQADLDAVHAHCTNEGVRSQDPGALNSAGYGAASGSGGALFGALIVAMTVSQSEAVYDRCMEANGFRKAP